MSGRAVRFVAASCAELRKVTWPSRREIGGVFTGVLLFVVVLMVAVSLADTAAGWLVLRLFGR